MLKPEPKQTEFIFSEDVYRDLIPKDHYLYKVNEKVDFSFDLESKKITCTGNRGCASTMYKWYSTYRGQEEPNEYKMSETEKAKKMEL